MATHICWSTLAQVMACCLRASGHYLKHKCSLTWWRHQMEIFSALLAMCAGNPHGEFPTQRPVTRSFDVFFDLRRSKWLSKQSWGGGQRVEAQVLINMVTSSNGNIFRVTGHVGNELKHKCSLTWWRHQMEIFSALLAMWATSWSTSAH